MAPTTSMRNSATYFAKCRKPRRRYDGSVNHAGASQAVAQHVATQKERLAREAASEDLCHRLNAMFLSDAIH